MCQAVSEVNSIDLTDCFFSTVSFYQVPSCLTKMYQLLCISKLNDVVVLFCSNTVSICWSFSCSVYTRGCRTFPPGHIPPDVSQSPCRFCNTRTFPLYWQCVGIWTVHCIYSSRRDKGQLKAKKLKTVFIQHTVNKITLSFYFIFISFLLNASCKTQLQLISQW